MIDFGKDVQECVPDWTHAADEYTSVTPLDWFNYQLATLAYDYKLPPSLVKAIESSANTLSVESRNEGFEQGDYLEGWQEGYNAAKMEIKVDDQ